MQGQSVMFDVETGDSGVEGGTTKVRGWCGHKKKTRIKERSM